MKSLSDSLALLLQVCRDLLAGVWRFCRPEHRKRQRRFTASTLANMDKSEKPGDNWYLYCNGDWIKNTPMPADRARLSVFSALDDIANKNTAAIIEEIAKAIPLPDPASARLPTSTTPTWTRRRSTPRASSRSSRIWRPSPRSPIRRNWPTRWVNSMRADVDALNNTNFHTIHLFGLWVAPGFNDPEHYALTCCRAASRCRSRLLPLRQRAHEDGAHQIPGARLRDAEAGRLRQHRRSRREDRRARARHRREALSLEENDDIHKANNTWQQADFTKNAPGLDWMNTSAAPDSASSRASSCGSLGLHRGISSGRVDAAGHLEGLVWRIT